MDSAGELPIPKNEPGCLTHQDTTQTTAQHDATTIDYYQDALHSAGGDILTKKQQGNEQFISILKIFGQRILRDNEKCLSKSKKIQEKSDNYKQKLKMYEVNIDDLTEKNKDLTNHLISLEEKLQSQTVLVKTQFDVKSLETKAIQNCVDQLLKHMDNLNEYQTQNISKLIENIEEINFKQEKMDEESHEMKKMDQDNLFNVQKLQEKANKYEKKLNTLEGQILAGNKKNKMEMDKLLKGIQSLQSEQSPKKIGELLNENCQIKSQKIDNLYQEVENLKPYLTNFKEQMIQTKEIQDDLKNIKQALKDLQSELSANVDKQAELYDHFNKLQQDIQNMQLQLLDEEQNNLTKVVDKKDNLERRINKEGDTLLLDAVKHLDWHKVVDLINQGANIECKDNNEATPLHEAAYSGKLTVLNELLNHGANIECKNKIGSTPIFYAAGKGHVSVLIDLLNHGANVNHKNNNGDTALHFAAQWDKLSALNELIYHNADIHYKNNDGFTPLHFAVQTDSVSALIELLNHGADISSKNNDGHTPLLHAVKTGHLSSLTELLNHGANINDKCKKGNTAIHLAASCGSTSIVNELIKRKANIHYKNNEGMTALDIATKNGFSEIIKVLNSFIGKTRMYISSYFP